MNAVIYIERVWWNDNSRRWVVKVDTTVVAIMPGGSTRSKKIAMDRANLIRTALKAAGVKSEIEVLS